MEIELVLDKYRAAGRILAEVREGAVAKVKEGALLLEVAEFVEQSTRDRGVMKVSTHQSLYCSVNNVHFNVLFIPLRPYHLTFLTLLIASFIAASG